MRHGESYNNVLSKISNELYEKDRVPEPELSQKGKNDCTLIGQWLKDNKIKIDRIYSSAHKRALQSAKLVLAELEKTIPVHIMHQIHEVGGVYMKGKTFPGLNEK